MRDRLAVRILAIVGIVSATAVLVAVATAGDSGPSAVVWLCFSFSQLVLAVVCFREWRKQHRQQ